MTRGILQLLFVIALLTTNVFSNPFKTGIDFLIENDYKQAEMSFLALPESKEKTVFLLTVYENQFDDNKFLEQYKKLVFDFEDSEPYLYSYFNNLIRINRLHPGKDDIQDILEELIEEKFNPILRGMAYGEMYHNYENLGEFGDREDIGDDYNSITKWSIVGEFENISASGFDKQYVPLDKFRKNDKFKNKNGVEVSWFDIKGVLPAKWIFLNRTFYVSNSIIFMQTFVEAEEETEVFLRFGRSGSLKIWLNDTEIFSDEEERNTGNANTNIKTVLSKGMNRILVQLGDSRINNSNFFMRVTDAKGDFLEDLEFYSESDNYIKNQNLKYEIVDNFAIEYFKKLIVDENDYFNRLQLIKSYSNRDDNHNAHVQIQKIEKFAPDNILMLIQKASLYQRQNNGDAAKIVWQRMKEILPEYHTSLISELNDKIEAEEFDEAEKIIKKIRNQYGDCKEIFYAKLAILSKNEDSKGIYNLIDEYYEKYYYDPSIVLIKSKSESDYKQNKNYGKNILQDYLSDYYDLDVLESYIEYKFEDRELYEALENIKYIIEKYPRNIRWTNILSNIYRNIENYQLALDYIDKCIELAPYVGSYYADKGLIYEDLENKSEAITQYQKALKYNQNQYTVINKLMKLEGKKELFEYFDEIDYKTLFSDAPDALEYPNEKGIVILDEEHRVVYDNSSSEKRVYYLAKSFNEEGIDNLNEFYVPVQGNQDFLIEKAIVIKENGSEIKAETNKNQIVFTNLEPGDGIYIVYKLQDYKYGKFAKDFWDRFLFEGYSMPILKSSYKLLVNNENKFMFKVVNGNIEPQTTNYNKYIKYTWEYENKERFEYEKLMPSAYDCLPTLHLSTVKDWSIISNWYYDISHTKAKSNLEIEETAKVILKGKENLNELEKAQEIYKYIIKNFRYSYVPFRQNGVVPQKSSSLLITKIGDCKDLATLFKSLCSVVGIETDLVLVNTRDNGMEYLALPSIDFNHVIAHMKYNGIDYFIDLTSDKFPFGTVFSNNYNAEALIISDKKENIKLFNLKTNKLKTSGIDRYTVISFNENKMHAKTKTYREGGLAGTQRYNYKDRSDELRKKDMLQAISSDKPNKIELTELQFDETLDNLSDTLYYYYEYKMFDALSKIASLEIFQIPVTDRIPDWGFIDIEKRKYPIDIYKVLPFQRQYEEMTINYPQGKKLAELPETVNIQSNFGSFRFEAKEMDDKVVIEREFILNIHIIEPEEYLKFRDFYKEITKCDYQNIGFIDAN